MQLISIYLTKCDKLNSYVWNRITSHKYLATPQGKFYVFTCTSHLLETHFASLCCTNMPISSEQTCSPYGKPNVWKALTESSLAIWLMSYFPLVNALNITVHNKTLTLFKHYKVWKGIILHISLNVRHVKRLIFYTSASILKRINRQPRFYI